MLAAHRPCPTASFYRNKWKSQCTKLRGKTTPPCPLGIGQKVASDIEKQTPRCAKRKGMKSEASQRRERNRNRMTHRLLLRAYHTGSSKPRGHQGRTSRLAVAPIFPSLGTFPLLSAQQPLNSSRLERWKLLIVIRHRPIGQFYRFRDLTSHNRPEQPESLRLLFHSSAVQASTCMISSFLLFFLSPLPEFGRHREPTF